MARDERAIAGVLPRITGIVTASGEGSWITDVDGRRYLDFSSGIAVTNVGHCHPRVVAAIQEQAARLIHTSVVTHHEPSVVLAERLRALTPFLDEPQVFFSNSGAEAVDGAIKLGRRVTGRRGIVGFSGAFHGRTMGATSLTTAKPIYQEGYGPLLPEVTISPYGEDAGDNIDGATAAVIVEPILGEGGYIVPPADWLAYLRARCDETGALLVFDEVQSGIGRTGSMWAAETLGVTPDVVLFAKGIASGMPLGGIIAGRSVMERWPTGAHGSTFGGNPVACAAAIATLDVIADDGLVERAKSLGEKAKRVLRPLIGQGKVVDVRGAGLMIGVETPDGEAAASVQEQCLAEAMVVLNCGPRSHVLRLVPPLNISDEDFALGLEILETALRV
ncbi:MAG TPA: aminotransferase class III-fold pyridoxal phosphate-dependent enzyme [Acidimicrobiales bacterium]|nr:aminotransferase class III-fold pyridoxal phosphate-dependent enzyme [Acidimicrobiales bacterium]